MFALIVVAAILQQGASVLLASEVNMARPLDESTILFSNNSGRLFTVDVSTGETESWNLSWVPEDDGWVSGGAIYNISVSPDLKWVCVAQAVILPESFPLPEECHGMRSVLVGVIAKRDGSGAWPAFIGGAAGGGPTYVFTDDSKLLVGSPMFACETTPESYFAFLGSERKNQTLEQFNTVETETRERMMLDFPDISDGFWKCPRSDYFRVENNWYQVHSFASFHEPELLCTWETPAGLNSEFLGWVLPDAVLLNLDEGQLLLFVDGESRVVEFPFQLVPVAWLPDGSYLYTENGDSEQLYHASIDWNSFEISDPGVFYLPEEMRGLRLVPMPGSRGIFCVNAQETGNLYFTRLPL